MPGSTSNMGLVTWTNLTDFFSHTDLVNNWTKVDNHDHIPVGSGGNGGAPIAAGGIQNGAITNSKLATDSVATANIQNSAVTAAKLATDSVATTNIQNGAVTAAKLGSDVDVTSAYTTYKYTPINPRIFAAGLSTGTNYFAMLGAPFSNTTGLLSGANAITGLCTFTLDSTRYAVPGRTTKFRWVFDWNTNGTAQGTQTFTISIVPVIAQTSPFTGGAYIVASNTPVTGSTLTAINPGTGTGASVSTADFTAPGTGIYAIRMTTSANMPTDARFDVSLSLLYRQV